MNNVMKLLAFIFEQPSYTNTIFAPLLTLISIGTTTFLQLCSLDFISEDSTVNQLVDIFNSFCKEVDEG